MTKKPTPKRPAQKGKLEDYRPDPSLKIAEDYDDHSSMGLKRAMHDYDLGIKIARDREAHGPHPTPLQYLMNRAKAEAMASLDQLIEVNLATDDGVRIATALQSRVIRYKRFVEWLEEAIQMGNEAQIRLQEEIEDQDNDVAIDDGETTDE